MDLSVLPIYSKWTGGRMDTQQMIVELLYRLNKNHSFRPYLAEMQERLNTGLELTEQQLTDLTDAWENPERDAWDPEWGIW